MGTEAAEGISEKEIVIVLDCSKSMEEVDGQYLAADFVKSLAAVLPGDYRMGMVAYNHEVWASAPLGSDHQEIEQALEEKIYTNYGNAGAGLAEAVAMFGSEEADRRILMVTDGEIMMKTEEGTQESADLFDQAVKDAKDKGIVIDIIALGQRMEEGYTVYPAADATGGQLYEVTDGEGLAGLTRRLLFDEWGLPASHVGKLDGTEGELAVSLPDRLMSSAKVIMLGDQQNDNVTVNCDAAKMNLYKGEKYTVIEVQEPGSGEIRIQMHAEAPMDINAYLTAEYEYTLKVDPAYDEETGTADLRLGIMNQRGQNLLEGFLKDNAVEVYFGNEKQEYHMQDGRICIPEICDETVTDILKVDFGDSYARFYGVPEETVTIEIPVRIEEERETDWIFWPTITGFALSLLILFLLSYKHGKITYKRHKVIDEKRLLPEEKQGHRNEFNGKIQVYVIQTKDGIDYPPESINLFARCSREVITLEWILDTCNLPLGLSGAEKIILRPGEDRSLIIRNNSKATVLMGRELLMKGHSYHLYYGEKVTFIFDREEAEIEVHYRDLKPNERQGR